MKKVDGHGGVVSRVVRTLMTARAEDQGDLAHVLGVTQAAVSNKLTGKTRWSIDDLDRMAEHYGIRAGDFLRGPADLLLPHRRNVDEGHGQVRRTKVS